MDELVIQLTGEIQKSNFEQWKGTLLEAIRSVDTELSTDTDYVEATKSVRQFKKAEKALKTAKESAIDQAAEINKLFDAIDEIAEETRQVRLSLDRQIKKRKAEIKKENVVAGYQLVKDFIAEQSEDFQLIDHAQYLDEELFEEAIKGKASAKGMQAAVTECSDSLKAKIAERAELVGNNAKVIDSLTKEHQPLFQDRAFLLAKSAEELNQVIAQRVDVFKQQAATTQEKTKAKDSESVAEDESKADNEDGADASDSEDSEAQSPADEGDDEVDWQLTIALKTNAKNAKQLRDDVEKQFSDNEDVVEVTLTQQDKSS